MSAPFFGEVFTFTQPDGTQVQVRGWGDQYHARFETLDGAPLLRNENTGAFELAVAAPDGQAVSPSGITAEAAPADIAPLLQGVPRQRVAALTRMQTNSNLPRKTTRWEARRAQARAAFQAALTANREITPAPPQRRTVGDFVGLCLLIDFPDVRQSIDRDEVERFCNQPGYSGFDNNGSVYDYFLDNSGGKLRYTSVVAPYYTAAQPRDYYTDESIEQPIRTWELILEALNYHRSQGFDFSAITTDSQNYAYALNVFYAGPRVNNWAKGLWPHSYHLESPYALMPGKQAYDYQITDLDNELTLGTFCHENGHMICDFPDLYDYGYDSEGIGAFCLMCAGGALPNTKRNPVQISAYLKRAAGWAEELIPITDGMLATASPGRNQFFIHAKNAAEYFLIENRSRTGRDVQLPDSGLAIWHVDHLGSNNEQAGTPQAHYECALMQADGDRDLEHGENPGDGTDLFPTAVNNRFADDTRPNSRWWNGAASGLELFDITETGSEITFSTKIS